MKKCIYCQNTDIVFRQEQDEAIIFNPDSSDILVMNSTGCFIWSRCNGKNTSADIADDIIEEFDITIEKASKDVESFISELEKRNFLEKV